MADIIATPGGGGDISDPGTITVPPGGDHTYTITPASGYRVYDVLVDGASVGPVLSYTFSDVVTNHTIAVTFILVDWINHIADGIVVMLKTINGAAGGYTSNFSTAMVERAPTLLDWTSVKRPYLGVRFDNITEQQSMGCGQYRVSGDFIIGFLIDVNGMIQGERCAPERLAAIMAQDIMRGIAKDVNLQGILDNGIAQPGPVQVSQDANLGALMAYGSVTVNASWVWQV